jgi:hypothetical protein
MVKPVLLYTHTLNKQELNMLNFIGVVFFAIMTLAGILAVIKPVTEDGKQVDNLQALK